jgi:putative FmdB family regulatory protein
MHSSLPLGRVDMPVYEYRCAACETGYEQKRPYSEASLPSTCPTCQSKDTRKLLSAVTVFTYDSTAAERRNFPAALAKDNQHCCSAAHCGGHAH